MEEKKFNRRNLAKKLLAELRQTSVESLRSYNLADEVRLDDDHKPDLIATDIDLRSIKTTRPKKRI